MTKLIVGHGPGAQADTVARVIAPKLAGLWGHPVLIENRIGAAGMIAANYVAKSPTDGQTLWIGSSTNLAIAAVMIKSLPFDPTSDLAMIGRIANIPTVLAVTARVPVQSVAQLVDYAKSRPGQLTAASSGVGSSSSFTLEMFKAATDIDILQVPYNGLAPAVLGLLSGQVDIVFAEFSLVNPHAKTGALRLLAAIGSQRLAVVPELPTMGDLGFDDVTIDSSIGVVAPAGTPPETIARLARDFRQVMRLPDARRQLTDLGFDPVDDTPAQFSASLRQDIDRFGVVARRLGIGAAN
jgi:tripartite-type tricarboxylate transporter receptor subunit TctC